MPRLLKDLQINDVSSASGQYGIVYKITCIASSKSYIGITRQTLARRWNAHVRRATNNHRGASALQAAIRKYGKDSFVILQLASAMTYDGLIAAEQELILRENTKAPNGYNLTVGGEGALNPAPETRARMRASHLGKKQLPEQIAKRTSWQLGSKRSQHAIDITRMKQLGVKRKSWGKHTDESRAKMRATIAIRRPRNVGYIFDGLLSMGA